MKLECFDKIGTSGKQFRNRIFRNGFTVVGRDNYLLTKLERQIFRETTICTTRVVHMFAVPLYYAVNALPLHGLLSIHLFVCLYYHQDW